MRAALVLLAWLAATSLSASPPDDLRFVAWPATRTLTARLAESAARTTPLPGMPADILARGQPIVVYVTPDERSFRAATGGLAPEWGAGVAFPLEGRIVLPGYGSDRGGTIELYDVLRHELAHVALQRRLGERLVPRWFTEGYAVWSARQLDADAAWLLRLAFATGRAPPLDSLELGWPREATDARVAYLLSATAVRYLYSLGGPATFTAFLDSWAEQGSYERALRLNYRLSSPQFERLWRRAVKREYGWLLFLSQGLVAGLIFTVLALVLFGIRRRRDRRKLAQLQAAELPDEPAYWLEPPPPEPGVEGGEEPPDRASP